MATTTVDLGPVIGPQGPAGAVDPTTPIPFTTPSVDADMVSGDPINTLFGKIKKRLSVLVDKIGDLTTLTTTSKTSAVSAINELNNNLAAGYVSKNIAAGATVEQAVSFSTSRQNTQYAVTLDQCSDGGTYTGITLSVKSKTADGFVIRIASSRSDTITLGVNWICIPYSA